MLSGVMLILVTMFAVLGAYYLSDVLTACLFRGKRQTGSAVVAVWAENAQDPALWSSVLDVRARMPQSTVVVVMPKLPHNQSRLEPSLQNVLFVTPAQAGEILCKQLMVPGEQPQDS